MKRINCKYSEYVFAPANAIADDDVETSDGVKCHVKYIATWNNSDGAYEDKFDDVCQTYFLCGFYAIRSIWISRLGYVSDYWHLVKMEKI